MSGPAVPGPILFRGGRIDGTGRLQFSGERATAADVGMHLTSGRGVSDVFYGRALHGPRTDGFYVYPSTKGCFVIQVDAPTLEDVIVVSAS